MHEAVNDSVDFLSTIWRWLLANSGGIVSAIIVLALGWYLSRMLSRLVQALLPRASGVDRNFAPLLSQVARYGVLIFALVTALSFIGVSSTSIYAVIGAAGLAIALALQNTLSNIAAGIMLIWQRPIAIGEYVVGNGVAGVVVEIGLFGTRLRSTSGLYIFVPNQTLWSGAITNHSRETRRRIDVNVTVPDTINVAAARKTMLRIATTDKRVQGDPPPAVHVETFVGDKIVLQMRAWVSTPDYLNALRDITEKAKVAINKMLAASDEQAEVALAADPHTQTAAEQTPDLS
ncbi:mechanosensitive ion channel domain-containing protein [Devosia sp.]|uniref:mechanosensitive ion channel family protein n=1 Tax=Devosia sp. TaxID=1871048 RepID=UPI001ACEC918|nr:mechanosensitive ion channel domain-containing protein [Devosia sp.]MBN9309405.1 mechanosensitive ion channel [Devosia sp.]